LSDSVGVVEIGEAGDDHLVAREFDVPVGMFRNKQSINDCVISRGHDIARAVQVGDFSGTHSAARRLTLDLQVWVLFVEFFTYLFERNCKAAGMEDNQLRTAGWGFGARYKQAE